MARQHWWGVNGMQLEEMLEYFDMDFMEIHHAFHMRYMCICCTFLFGIVDARKNNMYKDIQDIKYLLIKYTLYYIIPN